MSRLPSLNKLERAGVDGFRVIDAHIAEIEDALARCEDPSAQQRLRGDLQRANARRIELGGEP